MMRMTTTNILPYVTTPPLADNLVSRVQPLHVRVLRSVFNRLWGGNAVVVADESSDDDGQRADLDDGGVD